MKSEIWNMWQETNGFIFENRINAVLGVAAVGVLFGVWVSNI
jgi:hypothetical protein